MNTDITRDDASSAGTASATEQTSPYRSSSKGTQGVKESADLEYVGFRGGCVGKPAYNRREAATSNVMSFHSAQDAAGNSNTSANATEEAVPRGSDTQGAAEQKASAAAITEAPTGG